MKLHAIVWNKCGYALVKLRYILFGETLHMLLKNLQGITFLGHSVVHCVYAFTMSETPLQFQDTRLLGSCMGLQSVCSRNRYLKIIIIASAVREIWCIPPDIWDFKIFPGIHPRIPELRLKSWPPGMPEKPLLARKGREDKGEKQRTLQTSWIRCQRPHDEILAGKNPCCRWYRFTTCKTHFYMTQQKNLTEAVMIIPWH